LSSSWPIDVDSFAPIACGTLLWKSRGTEYVTVIAKATFAIVDDGLARLVAPDPLVRSDATDASGTFRASDVVPYLPHADVVLVGAAMALAGNVVPAQAVRLGIARDRPVLDKTIHVYGDRSRAGAPAVPFERMPLVYERAYGGERYDDNPVGMGRPGDSRLPNLVDPRDPERPACFAPIPADWLARLRALGGAQIPAAAGAVVEIPQGFNWSYFSVAPADQRIDFLRGDEWIVLEGFHRDRPRLQTRLPSVRAAARWTAARSARESSPRPVEMVADRLALDTDLLQACVVWRGRFAFSHAAVDSLRIEVGLGIAGGAIRWPEALVDEATSEQTTAFSVATAPTRSADEDGEEGTLALDAAAPGAMLDLEPDATEGTLAIDPEDPAATSSSRAVLPFKPVRAAPSLDSAWLIDEQTAAIIDPRLAFQALPFASPDATSLDAATTTSFVGLPFVRTGPSASAFVDEPTHEYDDDEGEDEDDVPTLPPVLAPSVNEAPSRDRQDRTTSKDPDFSGESVAEIRRDEPQPAFPAEPRESALAIPLGADTPADSKARQRVVAALASGSSLDDADLTGADLRGLDFRGCSLAHAKLRDADLRGARFDDAKLVGAQLEGALLEEASFVGADLTRADFTRAIVRRARFERARLVDVKLAHADGSEASFEGVSGQRVVFAKGSWDRAKFDGAELEAPDFSGASIAEASFRRAVLTDARLSDANASRAIFDEARFSGLRAKGARFVAARLLGVDAKQAVLTRADLSEADLANASLVSASLAESRLTRANLAGADLNDATLEDADLTNVRATGASFEGAQMSRIFGENADLSGSSLLRAELRAARLPRVNLANALLCDALADDSVLDGANLRRTDLSRASLRAVSLARADLSEARLEGTDLRSADLSGARLVGALRKSAKLAGAKLEGSIERDDEPNGRES